MSIWITGDTHTPHDVSKLYPENFPVQSCLTKDDYLIICGDFGGVWEGGTRDATYLQWYESLPWTTLFVDGNHENFELLNKYPTVDFCSGKAHQLRDHVYHLQRGEVFHIGDTTIFAMGGAASHDKEFRIPGISWWPEEMPSQAERVHAAERLLACDNEVDFVVSHCAPTCIARRINIWYGPDLLTEWFDQIMNKIAYKKWYFGHYHIDEDIDSLHTCLYQDVRRIV
ncbi:MAG: metallophosphoesterase [bacterium]|nr:metallophosphoesterase [bacterium]